MNIFSLRRDYMSQGIDIDSLDQDPFKQFELWFQQAVDSEIQDPNAFTLATLGKSGIPAARIVLLKQFDDRGFSFFTNYDSRKAEEIEHSSRVSMLFAWLPLNRQIRIEGECVKVSREESEEYFQSRPRGSQIAAWCSSQSDRVDSRERLEEQYQEIEQRYEGEPVPLPSFWGGYRIVPSYFEFWQGRENRLHDRVQYQLGGGSWERSRLAP